MLQQICSHSIACTSTKILALSLVMLCEGALVYVSRLHAAGWHPTYICHVRSGLTSRVVAAARLRVLLYPYVSTRYDMKAITSHTLHQSNNNDCCKPELWSTKVFAAQRPAPWMYTKVHGKTTQNSRLEQLTAGRSSGGLRANTGLIDCSDDYLPSVHGLCGCADVFIIAHATRLSLYQR